MTSNGTENGGGWTKLFRRDRAVDGEQQAPRNSPPPFDSEALRTDLQTAIDVVLEGRVEGAITRHELRASLQTSIDSALESYLQGLSPTPSTGTALTEASQSGGGTSTVDVAVNRLRQLAQRR